MGYAESSIRTWRATLHLILADAVEEGIRDSNPAARRRGRGKRTGRSRSRGPEKAVTTALGILLIAERAALLSGRDDEFVGVVTKGFTGMRWGELVGLEVEYIRPERIRIEWQLYELDTGELHRCPPKDDSRRNVDTPPFLHDLITLISVGRNMSHVGVTVAGTCSADIALPTARADAGTASRRRRPASRRIDRHRLQCAKPSDDRSVDNACHGRHRLQIWVMSAARRRPERLLRIGAATGSRLGCFGLRPPGGTRPKRHSLRIRCQSCPRRGREFQSEVETPSGGPTRAGCLSHHG